MNITKNTFLLVSIKLCLVLVLFLLSSTNINAATGCTGSISCKSSRQDTWCVGGLNNGDTGCSGTTDCPGGTCQNHTTYDYDSKNCNDPFLAYGICSAGCEPGQIPNGGSCKTYTISTPPPPTTKPVPKYRCSGGSPNSCVPDPNGSTTDPTCGGACIQTQTPTPTPTATPVDTCLDCGDPPPPSGPPDTTCIPDQSNKVNLIWMQVLSKEDDGSVVSWKGSQSVDPVVNYSINYDGNGKCKDGHYLGGGVCGPGDDDWHEWSVDPLDTNNYFQRYKSYTTGTTKTFDKTHNIIDDTMNISVNNSHPGYTQFYDRHCGDSLTTILPAGPETSEHWSNHFCAQGLADTEGGNGYPQIGTLGCGQSLYTSMYAVNCDVNDKKKAWPVYDSDGCSGSLGSAAAYDGTRYTPSIGSTDSSQHKNLIPLLQFASQNYWTNFLYDGRWTMTYRAWSQYEGYTPVENKISFVPPAQHTFKDVHIFTLKKHSNGDSFYSEVYPVIIKNDDGSVDITFDVSNPDPDGSRNNGYFVVIQVEKIPLKQCTIQLEDYVNSPNVLESKKLSIKEGTPFNVHVNGYSNFYNAPQAESVRFWLEKTDFSRILYPPKVFTEVTNSLNQQYYLFNSPSNPNYNSAQQCLTNTGTPCIMTATISELAPVAQDFALPEGEYNLHCDMNNPPACSGNPFCSINGGGYVCVNYNDCMTDTTAGPNDHVALSVKCDTTQSCTSCSAGGEYDGCGGQCPRGSGYGIPPIPDFDNYITGNYTMTTANLDIAIHNSEPARGAMINQYELVIYPIGSFANPTDADEYWAAHQYENQATIGVYHEFVSVTDGAPATFSINPAFSIPGWRDITIAVRSLSICNSASPFTTESVSLVANVQGNFVQDDSKRCTTDRNNLIATGLGSGSNVAFSTGGLIIPVLDVSNKQFYTALNIPYTPSSSYSVLTGNLNIVNTDLSNAYICSTCGGFGISQSGTCSNGGTNCTCSRSNLNADYQTGNGTNPVDFYLQAANLAHDPWWQIYGGVLYSTDQMVSAIPDTCGQALYNIGCIRSLILGASGDSSSDKRSAGIPIVDSSSTVVAGEGGGYYTQLTGNARVQSESGYYPSSHAQATLTPKQNYAYFRQLLGGNIPDTASGTEVISSFNVISGDQLINGSGLTGQQLASDTSTYVAYVPNSLKINLYGTTWHVPATEKWIIFVPGNLTIDGSNNTSHLMQVDEGGFLLFVVKNDITFGKDMGYDTDHLQNQPPANVEGVFVANHNIVIESKENGNDHPEDNQFVGAGTFIGWNEVQLHRSFADITGYKKVYNNGWPTNVFYFRPDLAVNTPTSLLKPTTDWKEVN